MRLCTVRSEKTDPFFGILLKNKILRIHATAEQLKLRPAQRDRLSDAKSYLQGLPHSEKLLRRMLAHIAEEPSSIAGRAEDGLPFLFPVEKVSFLPPVPNPDKVLCVGLNYRDHCEEQNRPVPEFPLIFNKYATSLIGHKTEIPLPVKIDPALDFEAELAFVIGKPATKVRKRNAMAHVAGYMMMNDVSARTLQKNERQWSRAKGFDGSGPCGPYLVTPDEVENPHELAIRCRVNGKVMQTSNTKHLIFKIEHLVQHITEMITLLPGDIVSTGTPGGVGLYREPQVFLKEGDEVEVEIEKIGTLFNRCTLKR